MTRFTQRLDLLGSIGMNRDYDDLLPRADAIELAEDLKIRVLTLETLIQVKEETSREKDLAILPILRRTLEEKNR